MTTPTPQKLTPALFTASIAKSNFSHILFDLDGTLVDSAPGIIDALSMTLSSNGLRPVCELKEAIIGPPLDDMLRIISGINDAAILKILTETFKKHYDEGGYKKTRLFPGINEMLHSLRNRGYTLHITTNKRLKPTILILNHFGCSTLFTSVYSIDKALPAYTNKTVMLLDQLADQSIEVKGAVYVGDSDGDRVAAEENKLHFIRAVWGYKDMTP